jgi:lipase chaperone LimK
MPRARLMPSIFLTGQTQAWQSLARPSLFPPLPLDITGQKAKEKFRELWEFFDFDSVCKCVKL